MKAMLTFLAVSGVMVSAAALTFDDAAAVPPVSARPLLAAASHVSILSPVRCWSWEFIGSCGRMCQWIAENTSGGYSYIWSDTSCDNANMLFEVNRQTCRTNSPGVAPLKITSCKVAPSPQYSDACIVTICGPVLRTKATIGAKTTFPQSSPNLDTSRYRIPAPRIGPPQPSLLDTDRGFGQQNPAATGQPMAPNITRGGTSSGGGLH